MHFIIEYKITGSLFSSIYLWGRELNSKTILVYFSVMSAHVINKQPVNVCRLENHIVVFRFHKMILVYISVMSVCAGNMQPALKSQKTPYPKSTSALSVKIPQVTNVLFMVLKSPGIPNHMIRILYYFIPYFLLIKFTIFTPYSIFCK